MNSKRKQYIYLDFDGAETFYMGDLLNIAQVTVNDSGFSKEQATEIAAVLNQKYAGELLFVTERPDVEDFSTIYIGQSDAFNEYGDFSGIAETIDKENRRRNDNAFVMADAATDIATVIEIISHEIEHIVYGKEHAETLGTLADFAASYSKTAVNKTIGGINTDAFEEWFEGDWKNCPSGARFSSITGSTKNDTITFTANRGRVIDGDIDLGPGNDKIILLASTTESEVTVEDIYMGSGNDSIEVYNEGELDGINGYGYGSDGSSINMGDGNDKILLDGGEIEDVPFIDMGNGNNTIEIKNNGDLEVQVLRFGSGDDTISIACNDFCEEDCFSVCGWAAAESGVFFGGGNDKMVISTKAKAAVMGNAALDFGAGTDTLELNGGLNFCYGQTTITGLEKIKGSGWIGISDSDCLDSATLNRFKKAGIKIYNNLGSSNFSAPIELSDNTRTQALDLTRGLEDGDKEIDYWLCGKTVAAKTKYGFADSVDWLKFNKRGETEIQIVGPTEHLTANLRDANGKFIKKLKTGYSKNDITSLKNGLYYLELSVKDNGYASGEIDIETEPIPVSSPDLYIKGCKVSSSTIKYNGSVKLTFTVANKGKKSAAASKLNIYDGDKLLKTVSVKSIAAGKSGTYSVTFKGSQLGSGSSKLTLVADAANKITETNESNNQVSKTIKVTTVDLYVKDYKINSSAIAKNGSVKLTFKVANRGNSTAAASKLKVYDGSKLLKTISVKSIAAGKSCSYSVTLKGSALGLGSRKITLVADADKKIAETNESNNKVSKTVKVSNADLYIKDYKVSSSAIAKAGSVKLTFKVANKGTTAAGASKLKVYDGSTLLKTISVASLAAGKSKSLSVTLKGSELGLGSRKIYLTADADKKVVETNESNNKVYKTVKVTAADLCITDVKISSSAVTWDGTLKLTFKVANKGNSTASASKLKICDGTTVLKTVSVSSLAAGKSSSFSVTLKGSELSLGSRTLSLTADADKKVAEANESNNKISKAVKVTAADLTVGAYGFDEDSILQSETATLFFSVTNKGNADAASTVFKIYDGSKVITSVTVAPLAAGASRDVDVTIDGSRLTAGIHELRLVVDADNKVAESNEANNSDFVFFHINKETEWFLLDEIREWDEALGNEKRYLLITDSENTLTADTNAADAALAALNNALGEHWFFQGTVDWDGNGTYEALFAGTEHALTPDYDEKGKLLLTLA